MQLIRWVMGEAKRLHVRETVNSREDFGDGRWRSTGKHWGEGIIDLTLWKLDFCGH